MEGYPNLSSSPVHQFAWDPPRVKLGAPQINDPVGSQGWGPCLGLCAVWYRQLRAVHQDLVFYSKSQPVTAG